MASNTTRAASVLVRSYRPQRHWRSALLFLAPFIVLFAFMYVVPVAVAVYDSMFVSRFTGLGLTGAHVFFDPLSNYRTALSDPAFLGSLRRVLLFGVVQVPFMLILATALALLIDSRAARARSLFRLAGFLPYVVPGVIAAMMWSFLYSGSSSPIEQALQPFGISIPFFGSQLTLWSVANVVTWTWTGYNMLIIYSSLTSIPPEILEAARVDGASGWRTAWHIKIPMVRASIILTTVFSIIGTAQLYNEPSILQTVSNGNITSTYTPIMAAQTAINAQNYYYAATLSVILAVIVGVLSFVFFKLTNRGRAAWN